MRGRYYYPQLARFISRDPAGLAGGLNMYAYAGDDPVDFSDPTGMGYYVGFYGGFYSFHSADFVNFGWDGIGGFVGSFVYQGLATLVNLNGLDKAVVEYYNGSQNGGGLRGVRLLAPIPYLPDPNDPNDSPGSGWVRKGPNWWNPKKKQSLSPDFPGHPPYGPHYDWMQRGQDKIRLRRFGPRIEFWDEDILEWLPAELLPLDLLP